MSPSATRTQALLTRLWEDKKTQHNLEVYAILDAARRQRIFAEIEGSGLEFLCLIEGHLPPTLEETAPYIVRLDPGSDFTRLLLDDGWGDSWGVLLCAPATLESLQQHFRKLLMVTTPDGASVFFRFYDPRVLRVFLPTCDSQQLDQIFGRVRTFFVEGEDGKDLRIYQRKGGRLTTETVPVG